MDTNERPGAPETPTPGPPVPPIAPQPKPGIPPGTPDWWGHPDAPWDTFTIQLWVDQIDGVDWRQNDPRHPNVFRKTLPCPRCTHQVTFDLEGSVGEDFDDDDPGTPVKCNCQTAAATHLGRLEGAKVGCGQNGYVKRP